MTLREVVPLDSQDLQMSGRLFIALSGRVRGLNQHIPVPKTVYRSTAEMLQVRCVVVSVGL